MAPARTTHYRPCEVKMASGYVRRAQVTVDRLPDDRYLVRVFEVVGKAVNLLAYRITTTFTGTSTRGFIGTESDAEGVWQYTRTGGCACGSPLARFVPPSADEFLATV